MNRTFSLWLALVITSASCAGQPAPAFTKIRGENTLLWQVSGNGLRKPSFLFGTFHLLCKDDIVFSDQLTSAMRYSDDVYMELDMDDPSILMGGFLYMNMRNDKTLKDLYNAEEYAKIEHYFNDTLHTPLFMLQKAKPYLLIALLYPKMLKCQTFSGIEEELVRLAKENKKEIKGLETVQFQSSVFDSIPYELQAKELIKNIDSFPQYAVAFDSMKHAYLNQDMKLLEKGLKESEPDMAGYEDILVSRRNVDWVKQLATTMRNRSVFVAVGAGHLMGDKGLIALLKKKGYLVEPLKNK